MFCWGQRNWICHLGNWLELNMNIALELSSWNVSQISTNIVAVTLAASMRPFISWLRTHAYYLIWQHQLSSFQKRPSKLAGHVSSIYMLPYALLTVFDRVTLYVSQLYQCIFVMIQKCCRWLYQRIDVFSQKCSETISMLRLHFNQVKSLLKPFVYWTFSTRNEQMSKVKNQPSSPFQLCDFPRHWEDLTHEFVTLHSWPINRERTMTTTRYSCPDTDSGPGYGGSSAHIKSKFSQRRTWYVTTNQVCLHKSLTRKDSYSFRSPRSKS